MPPALRGLLAVLGRVLLCAIFFMAAVGNKIPNFSKVAGFMKLKGMPAPELLLVKRDRISDCRQFVGHRRVHGRPSLGRPSYCSF